MSVFGNYARYYDLLYRDKNYQEEADFVVKLLREYAPHAQHLLELGCGTGRHAEYLIQAGYQVCGVERSPEMLAIARQRQQQLSPDSQAAFTITEGDLRTLHLGKQFDAVLALFHVISYQSTNEDLQAAFATVREHLKPGGIFLFDVWYGPAVLSDRPTPRIKRMVSEDCNITRFAEPTLYPNDNWVDVHYQIHIQDHHTQQCEFLQETHRMRYFFQPELQLLCQKCDLKMITCGEWLSQKPIGCDTWNVCFIASSL